MKNHTSDSVGVSTTVTGRTGGVADVRGSSGRVADVSDDTGGVTDVRGTVWTGYRRE